MSAAPAVFPVLRLERAPERVVRSALVLGVLGALAFFTALFTTPERAWRAYHFNWLFWTSIAHGAVLLAALVTITRGVWSRPVRRIALSFLPFVLLSFVLLIPLYIAGRHVFPWVPHPVPGKDVWLNLPFAALRDLAVLALLIVLELRFAYWALRPDAGLVRTSVPDRLRSSYDRLTRDWRGQEEEEVRAQRKLSRIAPGIALAYAAALSFVAWDLVMSLEPHWWSTLIGPYFFMAALLGGVAATALVTVIYRAKLSLDNVILPPTLHDLGKLTFAFCVFWAYLFWSQYLVIWYGMLPFEQEFVIHRLEPPFAKVAVLVFFCLFVIPFFGLLGVRAKETPLTLGLFACVVLLGLWLERYLLVYPSHYHGAAGLPLGWQEVGTALLFAALLIGSLMYFAVRFPLFQLWQPLSELELLGTSAEPPGEVVTAE